ncbi:MAG: YfcE family phosphodiesterase [Lachnospiraceae bacterium]|nr:YfcE family phosphodiesterase [Lachnospiraceae bacterium]
MELFNGKTGLYPYCGERVLIVSDSHGRLEYLEKVMERVKPGLILHMGDVEGDEDIIDAQAGCEVVYVRGNCDYSSDAPASEVVAVGRHKVFMTHGHTYGVGFGLEALAEAAKEAECDYAFFGHTHVPMKTEVLGVTIVNPGSISLPRQDGRIPTFAVADVDRKGDLHFKLCEAVRRRI